MHKEQLVCFNTIATTTATCIITVVMLITLMVNITTVHAFIMNFAIVDLAMIIVKTGHE